MIRVRTTANTISVTEYSVMGNNRGLPIVPAHFGRKNTSHTITLKTDNPLLIPKTREIETIVEEEREIETPYGKVSARAVVTNELNLAHSDTAWYAKEIGLVKTGFSTHDNIESHFVLTEVSEPE